MAVDPADPVRPTGSTPVPPAYRNGPFLRYVAGQAVSVLGDQVWYVALSWTAVRVASPGVAGVVLAVSSLPRLVLLLVGGALADRYDPRRLMIGSDLGRLLVSLVAAAVAALSPGVPLLIAVALLFGLADAVFLPAAGTVLPRLLHPEQLASGNATTTMAARLALTLGAPLGGILVAAGGLALACVVNAVTFAVSVLALLWVRPRPAPPAAAPEADRRLTGALREGLGYLVRHRTLRILLLVSLLTNLGFVGPMNVGLALVSDLRGWGAAGIGQLLAGFGVGAIVGAAAMARLRLPERSTAAACAAVQGLAVFAVAVGGTRWFAVGCCVLVGMTSGPLAIVIVTVTQRMTEDRFRGRVTSVNTLANLGITPLAIAAMGALAGWVGTVPAFAASASLELLAAFACLLWLRIPAEPPRPAAPAAWRQPAAPGSAHSQRG
ncbi:MFS transporter [Plantactinospora siamensis]|uniref:MFS transporter n=1 Tax=Plantactinospora siamensis TaxID=555372 RepID=A0ABV6NVY2_9ACTN